MSILVQSLARLYNKGVNPKISLTKLQKMLTEGTISQEEFNYIKGDM